MASRPLASWLRFVAVLLAAFGLAGPSGLLETAAALLDFSQGHGHLTVIVSPKQDRTAVRIVQTH